MFKGAAQSTEAPFSPGINKHVHNWYSRCTHTLRVFKFHLVRWSWTPSWRGTIRLKAEVFLRPLHREYLQTAWEDVRGMDMKKIIWKSLNVCDLFKQRVELWSRSRGLQSQKLIDALAQTFSVPGVVSNCVRQQHLAGLAQLLRVYRVTANLQASRNWVKWSK